MVVDRNWLYALSGALWLIAGGILCTRGYAWIAEISAGSLVLLEFCGLVLGIFGYRFGFSKITRRNIDRITTLPVQSSIFSFTAARGYILIIIMVSAGILLRSSAIPREYLSVPYTAMGVALILGSMNFWAAFVRENGNEKGEG